MAASKMKKRIIWAVCLVLFAGLCVGAWLLTHAGDDDYSAKYAGVDLTADVGDVSRENTYSAYLERYADAPRPGITVTADLSAATGGELLPEYQGRENVLMTAEKSAVTLSFDVPQAGMYCVRFCYCPVESRGIDAERALLINGESPFRGADALTFCRFWTDKPEDIGKTDNQGNEIRPQQIEVFRWETKYAVDDVSGYETEPYRFYFPQGENTVTLSGTGEPLAFSEIALVPATERIDYAEYLSAVNAPASAQGEWLDVIQGEDAALRSSQSLYATYDHASANTVPYSVGTTVLNMIGGASWTTNGQWIEWQVEVSTDGWYNLTFKGRQNYTRGQSASRKLLLDGECPFREAEEIRFQYDNDWVLKTLGNGAEDYRFYLTAGTHSVRLEVTLGEISSTVGKIEDSIYRLNQLYRRLLVIMGRTPDKYRDYDIDGIYPDMADAMLLESRRLYEIADEVIDVTGGKSSMTGTITVLADILEDFSGNRDLIKRRLQTFRDDITSLGTTMTTLKESQLDIDYLVIKTPETALPEDEATLLQKAWHEVRLFASSFATDYDALGNVYDEDEIRTIEVWILTGRDQANILKTIIDDSFTPDSGIAVNLKLVESGTVLSAVAAGSGPDVVLSAGQGEPVNYALRNAAVDLSRFDGFEEVLSRFTESACLPFEYEGGMYALPEAQYFNVLYYRRDILDELGLKAPETWEELRDMLPVLQHNNMETGMPDIMRKSGPDLSGFYSMLYQNGCELYTEDGKYALLDKEGTIRAFEDYAAFYTNYDIPKDYSFVDRFRSGEMPIGLADYTTQNTLSVFAPELKGLWDFTLIPGTRLPDGTVDHSVQSNCTASMMLRGGTEAEQQAAWEFLVWWTSTEIQARFGREMECLMGAAARYATANVEACQMLSWSADQLEVLNEQRGWTKANREVAGGYYTSRHIVNAIRKVINDNAVPRETILDYNRTINDEIKKKRAEFNLD